MPPSCDVMRAVATRDAVLFHQESDDLYRNVFFLYELDAYIASIRQ
jgi:hypothetical protein